jgi:hypothetical protein
MIAQSVSSIDDALIARIRGQMVARDLVFEKVDENSTSKSPRRGEKAVYVANSKTDPEAWLVAEVTLKNR